MNKVILTGRLGKDPESKYTQDGTMVTSFSLATSENYKDKNGEKVQKTEWHNITAYGKPAEICAEYLKKGSQVLVEGQIKYQKWEKDGQAHYRTHIKLVNLEMLGRPKEGGEEVPAGTPMEDVPF